MASKRSVARLCRLYARLLRLYPKSFHRRFGEGMEQTFNDCLRERAETGDGVFHYALWMSVETWWGMMRENIAVATTHHKRLIGIMLGVVFLLIIPLVAMQFTNEVNWNLGDFAVMGGALLAVGFAFELVARRSERTVYRVAFGVGIAGAFLLFWANGAVGIIGNEGQAANLLYVAVFAVGLIGSAMARFKTRGMAWTLSAMALMQVLVPVLALVIWPQVSWGATGMFGVFYFNGFFVLLFVISALLFRHAGIVGSRSN